MNENMSLEELKQHVAAIQQRIEEIEKEASQKEEKKTPLEVHERVYYQPISDSDIYSLR